MSSDRPILLYVHPRLSAFIERDIASLGARFDVRHHGLLAGPKVLLPWRLLLQLIFLVRHKAWKHDIICHFAGYHSVLPVILGRRCFVILAGSDGACFPNIDYGNFRKPLYAWATRFTVRRATRLLPVDGTLIEAGQQYDRSSPARQGIKAFVPGLTTPWTVVHYGFDAERWKAAMHEARDPKLFVCVASGAMPGNAVHFRKGIDLILRAARDLPSATFIIVGSPRPSAYDALPPNVLVQGRLDPERLRLLYSKAAYYLQPSMMEGFPNALCEAMLCGCVPIVSSVAAMPAIVGHAGHICHHRDPAALAGVLHQALTEPAAMITARSITARSLIAEQYDEHRRTSTIVGLLTTNGSRPGLRT